MFNNLFFENHAVY